MTAYDTSSFEQDLESLKISLSGCQMDQFLRYYELLTERNKVMNLTAITEFDEVVKKHFVDSLSLVKAFERVDGWEWDKFLLDLGTGAGFPGIPLKIAFPDLHVVLLDSLRKRVDFLEDAVDALHLDKVRTLHARAEELAAEGFYRERFDLCVSRAVANLRVLSEYCLPFVKMGGYFIPYKSEKLEEELKEAGKAVTVLGGEIKGRLGFCLPNSDIYRNFVLIYKAKVTPKKFPRKAGLPAKKPI